MNIQIFALWGKFIAFAGDRYVGIYASKEQALAATA